ncbi:MAG: UDP-N-acetyl-D-glucosamine 6-dehydrogenase [Candidatus Omnitrophica bacterium ADurb.Bin205]|nr:MAG: UDP-N-acetyl-D-glucosamine 6-dehydrogenase [Candidatus Omnitrophica bacterium ADurb.Bin205]
MGFLDEFKARIKTKNLKVAVVGLGYVGLPLAIEFAKKGFSVFGVEIDKDRLVHLKKRETYISDVTAKELKTVLVPGRLIPCGDFKPLRYADVVIVCVPTPLKRKYHPDISFIKEAIESISRNLKRGSLIILESTTYPGTTEEVILPLLEKRGLRHGKDFYLCFSPERIDPGNLRYPVSKIPKIIGGINKDAGLLGKAVYEVIVERAVMVSSTRVAEITKLLENTFRIVNIGLVDEMAMMAHKMKIDIWEVIDAASTKPFGFMPFYPGPGVGGHCIPKDPLYLYWKAKKFGFRSRFIKLASDVISFMPGYVVKRVEGVLRGRGIGLSDSKILIIGVTYKKDIKDLRKSPALDIIEILRKSKAKVAYHDPIVPYLRFPNLNLKSLVLNKANLRKFDCTIIATNHSFINYDLILNNSKSIFDTRNVYIGKAKGNVVRL